MSEGAAQTTERFEVIAGASAILGSLVAEILGMERLVRRLMKQQGLSGIIT
jgi:hypothetical protein